MVKVANAGHRWTGKVLKHSQDKPTGKYKSPIDKGGLLERAF